MGVSKYLTMLMLIISLLMVKAEIVNNPFVKMEMDHTKLEHSRTMKLTNIFCASMSAKEGDDIIKQNNIEIQLYPLNMYDIVMCSIYSFST